MLSLIIPAYNEEETILLAASKLQQIMSTNNIPYELIFIDDGSKDTTWSLIENISKQDSNILGVRFSRNFGKDSAIFAGLNACHGDCAVILDCDMQHPPEKIPEMYRLWEKGVQIVEGVKTSRGDETALHRFCASKFYSIMSHFVKIDMENASDFKLLDRKVIDTLLTLPEHNMFFRTLSSWVGYKKATVSYDVAPRIAGSSKWSTKALTKYAITSLTSFSTMPMQIVTGLGIFMFAITVILGIWTLIDKFTGHAIEGITTIILLQLFIGSISMMSLGIIGYYIARIFEEVKGRPRYIISETIKADD